MVFPDHTHLLVLFLLDNVVLNLLADAIFLFEERAGCFAFIVLRMSCYCKCVVTLPHGAVGWSAVCDCGIP